MIKLDILSDPICPWCFIGKSLLDRALQERPDHPFSIEWHPFQLNPDMPAGGMDRRTYLETKFGGKEQAVEVYARIAEAAEAAGLEIDFGAIQRTPNTLDAHRLIHWAGIEAKQTPVVDALFAAYFQQGRDIGDHDTLADIADSVGMDAAAVHRLLAGTADAEDIRARDANAREKGVTGVPTFIIANQHVVPGAQQPDLWLKLVDEINGQM
ncbi:putative DsbA family dithiol-disulfide isomerase [Aliiruegeria haliotis]|uniref:Putative DsbA family dithiol-disulfide isomerase n=1 Tax=Aliiruegeria haliotis TaxID=1280846 RepID=A0A2T0RZ11_9RHOB|nr:DsbA family oxidoreductase [Aliiruegeria haliotis]PRY26273.1 putative DsbA family dithiol-disulfide isomerase [Aliiruegeria haliotis]